MAKQEPQHPFTPAAHSDLTGRANSTFFFGIRQGLVVKLTVKTMAEMEDFNSFAGICVGSASTDSLLVVRGSHDSL